MSKALNIPITQIVLFVVGKSLGIMFASMVFGITTKFSNLHLLFTPSLSPSEELVLISSYSDLFMFAILASALLLSLFMNSEEKTYLTLEDIKSIPSNKLHSFYSFSRKLYGKSINWLVFLWLVSFYILYNSLLGRTYLWIYLLSVILTLSISIYFYFDFDKELELHKKKYLKENS